MTPGRDVSGLRADALGLGHGHQSIRRRRSLLGATEYLSLDTPLHVASTETCGHVVYSDLHVSLGPGSGPSPDYPGLTAGGVVPDGCSNRPLTPQEKAFEFLFFDMSSCAPPTTVLPPAADA